MFSVYTDISDFGIFLAAILGLFGIAIEGLCYFGIYCLMAAAVLMNVFGNQPWANAISCAWISVGIC